VNSIDQITYQEFAKGLTSPCAVGIATWGKAPANMLINMSLRVALPMLDRLCGGGGNPPGVSRTLTEIEMAMTRRMLQNMTDLLRMSLREFHVQDQEINVTSLEVNPLFIQQAMPPNDMVLSASVAIKFGAQRVLWSSVCLMRSLNQCFLRCLQIAGFLGGTRPRAMGRPRQSLPARSMRSRSRCPAVWGAPCSQ
jgi:flagellar motor switch protein FliM